MMCQLPSGALRCPRAPCPTRVAHVRSIGRVAKPAKWACNAGAVSAGAELHVDISRKLYSEAELEGVCKDLGRKITADYDGIDNILVLSVLKGGFVFTADLVRHIRVKYTEVDFIRASSYGSGTVSSGSVEIANEFDMERVRGRHILVVEDIVDSGLTLSSVVALITKSGAASVKVVTLLDKRARRKVDFTADYIGLDCPDEFIVGYGIDYAERYRHLPYIGIIKPEAI